jgi:glutaredoxin
MTAPDGTPIVYYQPGCPFAARLRAALTLARVPHRSVRFRDDEAGAAAVRARHEKGYELSPTVVIDGDHLTNPSLRQVRRALARR